MQKNNPQSSLWELAWLFLRLGATSFGGPAAHISLMETEFVHRRQWVSRKDFLDLLALANLIPGPNSTELAIHLGYRRAGWPGLVVAGVCFILPAFLIVTAVAAFYAEYARLPHVEHFLTAVKAVILAIILQAGVRFFWSLLEPEKKDSPRLTPKRFFISLLFLISILAHMAGLSEIPLLFMGGLLAVVILNSQQRLWNLAPLFWVFFKVGSVLFGSGYVLLSFLKTELVVNRPWLTESQLMDAIAVGQFTPGPVFTTASFIGYILQGPWGALIATVGIFLPAFLFVALSIPLHARMKHSVTFNNFLTGVVTVSVGLLFSTFFSLTTTSLTGPLTWTLFLGAMILLHFKAPSALLILGAGLLGIWL